MRNFCCTSVSILLKWSSPTTRESSSRKCQRHSVNTVHIKPLMSSASYSLLQRSAPVSKDKFCGQNCAVWLWLGTLKLCRTQQETDHSKSCEQSPLPRKLLWQGLQKAIFSFSRERILCSYFHLELVTAFLVLFSRVIRPIKCQSNPPPVGNVLEGVT